MHRRTFVVPFLAMFGCGRNEEPRPAPEVAPQAAEARRIGFLSPFSRADIEDFLKLRSRRRRWCVRTR
jgi:hypothetical protein